MKNVPTNLSTLKSKVDKLDVDKLVPVSVDLSKITDVIKKIVKKDVFNAKMKNIENKIPHITNFATNTTLNAKLIEVKGEKPSITNLAAADALDAKINLIQGKIPSITNLATTTALTAVQNKIPNVGNLVKKNDYNTKISEIENKLLLITIMINIKTMHKILLQI